MFRPNLLTLSTLSAGLFVQTSFPISAAAQLPDETEEPPLAIDCTFEAATFFSWCLTGDPYTEVIFCYKDPGEDGFVACVRDLLGKDVSEKAVNACLDAAVAFENDCRMPPKEDPKPVPVDDR